ncbi:MAG: sugar phosphate isomerase/epimerase [Actinobacteria bacterium]|nr:sugar phosphate isomerase/epimerase [Actinomycetota bacterium]
MRAALMESVVGETGDVFEIADRLGFGGVEPSLGREALRSANADQLRVRRGDCALEIHALGLVEHNHGGIADADPSIAEAAEEDVRRATAWAAELGAEVVLVPFFMRGELVGEAGFDRCAAAFASLCPLAAERGVTLCYEGLLPAREIRRLAERVGSPAFGCYFDLANPLRRGLDSPTELRALGELVKRVHVKDILVRPGDVHPGLGRVDFGECAHALSEIRYDGWLTLETPCGPPPLVARDLSFTRSVFPGLERASTWPRFGAFSNEFAGRSWGELADEFERLALETVVLGGELLDECLDDPDSAASRRAFLEERGITIAGLAGYRNLVAPDPAIREANITHLERCLELAPALGTWIVATETGTRDPHGDWTDSPENWGSEAWRLLDDAFERLVPTAERWGTILAVEGYVKNVLKTQSQLHGLLERFPTKHLQVVCDPYNWLSGNLVPAQKRATAELLDRFEHRFVAAHLKDVLEGGAEAGTPELGTGIFEQRPYLEFLRDHRPDLDLVVEHLPPEHVPRVTRTVRGLVDTATSDMAS